MKGRKPEKKLINTEEVIFPEAPDYLDEIGKDRWLQVCSDLQELGLYSTTDLDSIELYCRQYSVYRRLDELSKGNEFVRSPNGYVQTSQQFIEANKACKQCEFMLRKLGLNPTVRQTKAKTKGTIDSKWNGIL